MQSLGREGTAVQDSYNCNVDSISGADWDQLVASFTDGVIDQTWSYATACYGHKNLSNVVLRHDDDIVAACQVLLMKPPVISKGIAHVKFGPMWKRRGHDENPLYLRQILECLHDEYVGKRGMYLRVMLAPTLDGAGLISENLSSLGFAHNAEPDPERFLVNLSAPSNEIRAELKSKWRYHLSKSEKQNLRIVHGTAAAKLDEFLDLYIKMRTHKKFADPRALTQLSEICDKLPPDLKPDVWLCYSGEQAVAGAVVSSIGNTAYYLFGATDMLGRKLRAGYLMHWTIVNSLLERDCNWYDLGGGSENAGLIQFKSGLIGKNQGTHSLPGNFDSSAGKFSASFARTVFGLRRLLGSVQERLARMGQPQ